MPRSDERLSPAPPRHTRTYTGPLSVIIKDFHAASKLQSLHTKRTSIKQDPHYFGLVASVNISVERMLDACATAVDRCATLGLLLALSLLHEKQTPQWLFTDLHMRAIVAAHIFTDRRLAELTADNGDGTASGNSAAANATSPSNSGDGIASLTRWQPLFALPGDRHARLHASRAHLCRYGLLLDAAPIAGMVGEMHQFVQRTVRETRLTVDAAGSSALVRTLEDLLCYHYQHCLLYTSDAADE